MKIEMRRFLLGLKGPGHEAVLARGASAAFIIKVAGVGVAFLLQVLFARLLGAESYGIYVYVLSWVTVLLLFTRLGLDVILIRYVPVYATKKEWGLLRGVLRRSARSSFMASIVIGVIMISVVLVLRGRLGDKLAKTFLIAPALLPLLTLASLWQSALFGLKRVVAVYLPELVIYPLLLAAIVVGLFLSGRTVDGPTAMLANLLARGMLFLLVSTLLRRGLPDTCRTVAPEYRNREWAVVVVPLFLISGMEMILDQTDVVLVGIFLGTTQAGIYSAATRVANLLLFGLISTNTILGPLIAQLYATGQTLELQRMLTLAAKGLLAFSLPAAVLVIALGKIVLAVFGPAFPQGRAALVILVVGRLVNALAGSVGLLLTVTAYERLAALIVGTAATVNIILQVILIPRFGIVGAALATSSTMVLWNVWMLVYVQKHLGVNPSVLAIRKRVPVSSIDQIFL